MSPRDEKQGGIQHFFAYEDLRSRLPTLGKYLAKELDEKRLAHRLEAEVPSMIALGSCLQVVTPRQSLGIDIISDHDFEAIAIHDCTEDTI